jgi:hypothetical protein
MIVSISFMETHNDRATLTISMIHAKHTVLARVAILSRDLTFGVNYFVFIWRERLNDM